MKKQFLSLLSVILLVSPLLIGTGQVLADTNEPEQIQKQGEEIPNKTELSDSLQNNSASESKGSIKESSINQTNSAGGTNESTSSTSVTETTTASSSTNAHEQDSLLQKESITERTSLLADTVASGTLGTVDWKIDADGILHIDGGQLPRSVMTNNGSPFYVYTNQIISIIFEGKVIAGESLETLFMGLKKVKSIENLSYLDTSQTTNMHYMFFGMSALTSIDVSGFDTSKVSDMAQMFANASSLTSLDVSNFDTSSVTSMGQMFYGMESLTSLDLSNFETPNLTGMSAMFSYSGIKSLDISNFNTLQAKMGTDTFWQTPIEHIKLGENFVFKDSLLGSPPIDNTYIGKWQRNQSGTLYTSLELATTYNGATMNGDWYWATSQEDIDVVNSSIYVGDKWQAKDNFISAIDKDGNPVDFKDITVEGTVDTTKAGTYEVKYSYDGVTSVATITVKAIQTAVSVHDSTLYSGTEWKAADNFDSAIDKDGNPVDFKDITVEGTVDTTKAGTYEVKYSYDGVISVATITISDKDKDSTPNNDNNKGQDSQNTGEKALPQTGEQANTIWTLAGFLTVLLSWIYLVKKRKKPY